MLLDGLLVTIGSTNRSIRSKVVGTWSLQVVVDVLDQPNERLHDQVQQLSATIASLTYSRRADNDTKAFWHTTLRFIADQLPRLVTHAQRHTIGMLDAGGIVVHRLFGVATSTDIEII